MGEIVLTPFDIIFKAIRKEMKVNKQDILSRDRTREVCEARQMFCMLARRYTIETTTTIGEAIKRDHSSVVYNNKSMSDLTQISKRLRIAKNYIEKDIKPQLESIAPKAEVCSCCNQVIL